MCHSVRVGRDPRLENDVDSAGVYDGVSLEDMGYGNLRRQPKADDETSEQDDEAEEDAS